MNSWKCYGGGDCHNEEFRSTLGVSGYCICETQKHNADIMIASQVREIANQKLNPQWVNHWTLVKMVADADKDSRK